MNATKWNLKIIMQSERSQTKRVHTLWLLKCKLIYIVLDQITGSLGKELKVVGGRI